MNELTRPGFLLTASALLLVPATAAAICVSATTTQCVCARQGTPAAASLESISGTTGTFRVDDTFGADGGVAAGDAFTGAVSSADVVGSRHFIFAVGAGVDFRLPIEDGGTVLCSDAEGRFPLQLESAAELARASDCPTQLYDSGFREPQCHDTDAGLSSPPPSNPPASPGCTATSFGPLLSAGLLAVALLRRRRSAPSNS